MLRRAGVEIRESVRARVEDREHPVEQGDLEDLADVVLVADDEQLEDAVDAWESAADVLEGILVKNR